MQLRAVPTLLTTALLASAALAGCAAEPAETIPAATTTPAAPAGDCDGVRVVVEFTVLDEPTVDACATADGEIAAYDALAAVGVTTEPITKYGDATICRVDGEPAADETVEVEGFDPIVTDCSDFTAGAFWAIWERPVDGEWAFAQVGINELTLEPGETLGLVYTTGDGSETLPPATE